MARVVADSAILGFLAPGTLTLSGWMYYSSYQSRLGLHDLSAMPPLHAAMVKGLWLLVWPALGLLACYTLAWLALSWQERRALPLPTVSEIPLLAWAAGGAWFAATFSLIGIGDESPTVVEIADFTVLDVILLVFGISVVTALVTAPLHKGIIAQLLAGPGMSGTVFMGLLLISGLAIHSSASGADDGSEHAWGCVDYPGVLFESQSNDTRDSPPHLLIAHVDGRYYLRDMALPGDQRQVLEFAEGEMNSVRHTWATAIRDC